eukprot:14948276-Alexandrium_andersonii.AAC.1
MTDQGIEALVCAAQLRPVDTAGTLWLRVEHNVNVRDQKALFADLQKKHSVCRRQRKCSMVHCVDNMK